MRSPSNQFPIKILLAYIRQNHLAYPVIHYFHNFQRQNAAEVSVVVLDEALTLLEYAVKSEHRPDAVALYTVRQSIEKFLETLNAAYIKPSKDVPPLPRLDELRASGIPTFSDEDFEEAVSNLNRRRRLLLALVRSDGWSWKEIVYPFD